MPIVEEVLHEGVGCMEMDQEERGDVKGEYRAHLEMNQTCGIQQVNQMQD